MKNKNNFRVFKRVTALVLALTIFSVIPKYRRCEEPEPFSTTQTHSFISPHQNGILDFD